MRCGMEADPVHGHARYQTIRPLGRGAFGLVLLARDTERHEQVATKFLPRGSGIGESVELEIMNHKDLLHPHVIQFKNVFFTDDYLAISKEYAPDGNLGNYLPQNEGISEDVGRWLFQQLSTGLEYIHEKGMVSRNIELEDSSLDDGPWLVRRYPFEQYGEEGIRSLLAIYQKIMTADYQIPPVLCRLNVQT